MLHHVGVESDHSTHITRGCASRMAELIGVPEDQIRRLGHWQAGAMEKHYLSALPRLGMRAMAGVKNFHTPGNYFLKRDCLEPPESLKRKVFPKLDSWLQKYRNNECQHSLSCLGFLNMLEYFRGTILQDSVVLMEKYPDLFLWNHDVFQDPAFHNYKTELLAAMAATTDPISLTIRAVVPTLATEMAQTRQVLTQAIEVGNTKMGHIGEDVHTLRQQVVALHGCVQGMRQMLNNGMRLVPVNPVVPMIIDGVAPMDVDGEENILVANQQSFSQSPPAQQYKMIRDEKMSVASLWEEWKTTVEPLEQSQGTAWRPGGESRYFQRRKKVIDAIQQRINGGMSPSDAVATLETMRAGKSLNKLSQEL